MDCDLSERRDNRAFMAWTASEPLNRLLLVDAPALVLSPDGAHMLWANPSGAARLGAGNLESLLQEEFPESLPLRRQISHLFRWLRGENEQVQRLRLGRSAATPLDMVRVSKLRNLDGVSGILLRPVGNAKAPVNDVDADVLTDWLASGHHYAALLSASGDVIAASGAFQELRKAAGELQDLLDTADDSLVPVSRHLNIEAGVRHLVTVYKMPFGGAEAFLLLVDGEEVSLRRTTGPMTRTGDLINMPKAANDTERAPRPPEVADIEKDDFSSPPTPKPQVTLEDVQMAIQNAMNTKVSIDSEGRRAEPPKDLVQEDAKPAEAKPTADIMRFVWRMDEGFKFTFVSPEFQVLVGLRGAFEGRTWQDIAGDYQLDPDKKIQEIISSKDLWGGQRVTWALPKRKARAEIELSAMPVFDDQRKFQGYRGFGSCRLEQDEEILKSKETKAKSLQQKVIDENTIPEIEAAESAIDVSDGTPENTTQENAAEFPAIIDTRESDQLDSLRGLTADERKAFEEIGRTIGGKVPTGVDISEVTSEEPVLDVSDVETFKESTSEPTQGPEPATISEIEQMPAALEEKFPRLVPRASAEAELRSILDRLTIGVLVVREDRLLYANKHLAQMAGYSDTDSYLSAKAAASMGGFALDPVKNSDGVMKFTGMNNVVHSVRATIGKIDWMGAPASLLVVDPVPVTPDAAPVPVEVSAGSEAWNAEELLAILNTATEGVLMINSSGKVLAMNHGAEALFGESQEALKGKELTELLAPESHKVSHDYLQSILGAGVASVLNDGRDVIGRTTQGGYMPLFMTMGRVGDQTNDEGFESLRLCVVLRDITQWKRAEDDLIAARHNAEKANTAKSDFLAKISHEIRTPLNAILGFSEVIMEERFGPIGNPRYKDYISDIHTSGAHVINLVNDMLDISKIEAGQLDLSFAAVDLGEVLKECVAVMQPQANEARVIIRTSLSEDLPRVVADAKTIRQIALNLLSNSIKFTAEGGQVIVSAVLEKDGDLVLRVRDTGIGMDEMDIATAMEPFRQLDSANAPLPRGKNGRTGGGTGLGLPLTKALVEANRADFSIESTPEKGTLIKVVFPNTRVLAE